MGKARPPTCIFGSCEAEFGSTLVITCPPNLKSSELDFRKYSALCSGIVETSMASPLSSDDDVSSNDLYYTNDFKCSY